jgi:hypothetical protein
MQFLFPNILYALFLALIPLILHLINLRKHKKMYFSSLWFLKSIKQQTSRSKKIYEWILLIVRTILIAAIILAFAEPVIQNNTPQLQTETHLILDNTYSLQNNNDKGNLFDQLKNKALEITDNIDANSINIHFLASGKSFNNTPRSEAQNIIQKSKLEHGNKTINDIFRDIKKKSQHNRTIILSDFQQNIVYPDTIFNDSLLQVSLVLFKGENTNISIDSIWFDKPIHVPNEETEVSIQLKNYSKNTVTDIPIQLYLNEDLTSVGTINIEPNDIQTFKTKIQIKNEGFIKLKALTQDLPVNFDNEYHTGIYISPQYQILEIGDTTSQYLKALFNEKDQFVFRSVSPDQVTLTEIQEAHSIIINQPVRLSSGIASAINKAVLQGSNLIIIPNQKADINNLNDQYSQFSLPKLKNLTHEQTIIKQLNLNSPIYSDAISKIEENTNFPKIPKYYTIENLNNLTPLIYNDFDEPILLHGRMGSGNTYFFAFNPFIRNFALDPLFIPTLYNAAVISNKNIIPQLQCTKPSTFTINKINNPEYTSILIGEGSKEFIPYYYTKQQFTVISIRPDQLSKPGYYPIKIEDSTINYIAVNHLNEESKLEFHSEDYLQNQIFAQSAISIFSSNDTSTTILAPVQKLWKWFALLAFLMILVETVLLLNRKRVKKHT